MYEYLFVLTIICCYFAWSDIRRRRLDNLPLLFFCAFQLMFLIYFKHVYFKTAVIVLLVGMLFFCFKILAAGDVKLAFIMALGVKLEYLNNSLLIMLFAGGIQSIYYLLKHHWYSYRYGTSDVIQRGLPYGIAICIGFYIGTLLSLS